MDVSGLCRQIWIKKNQCHICCVHASQIICFIQVFIPSQTLCRISPSAQSSPLFILHTLVGINPKTRRRELDGQSVGERVNCGECLLLYRFVLLDYLLSLWICFATSNASVFTNSFRTPGLYTWVASLWEFVHCQHKANKQSKRRVVCVCGSSI